MTKPTHKILEKSEDKLSGICALCGEVPLKAVIYKGSTSNVCSVAYKANANRPRPGRKRPGRKQPTRYTYTSREGPNTYLTATERESLIEGFGNSCNICGSETGLVVDHCHISGILRGSLCGRCNSGLGLFKDNPELLEAAKQYLNRF